jgi:hypothetical protein
MRNLLSILRIGLLAPVAVILACLGLAAAAPSTAGAASPPASAAEASAFAAVPAPPSQTASVSAWQQWAAAQRHAMESATWSSIEAAEGAHLVSLQFLPVTARSPTAPAGITTIAVGMVTSPGATGANPAVAAGSDPTHCEPVKDGTGCINSRAVSGGGEIQATYEYTASGSITGRLDLGRGGCPGTYIAQLSGLVLTHDETAKITYGPVNYSNTWSSTFFHGSDTDFGSVCASY